MAEWQTPKVDYWNTPRPVGGEDYKRIEGNIKWLYDYVHSFFPVLVVPLYAAEQLKYNTYSTLDWYSVGLKLLWNPDFVKGRQIRLKANIWISEASGEARVRLYNYSQARAITQLTTDSRNDANIVVSETLSIPENAIIGLQTRVTTISYPNTTTLHLAGAWLEIK